MRKVTSCLSLLSPPPPPHNSRDLFARLRRCNLNVLVIVDFIHHKTFKNSLTPHRWKLRTLMLTYLRRAFKLHYHCLVCPDCCGSFTGSQHCTVNYENPLQKSSCDDFCFFFFSPKTKFNTTKEALEAVMDIEAFTEQFGVNITGEEVATISDVFEGALMGSSPDDRLEYMEVSAICFFFFCRVHLVTFAIFL